MNISQVLWFACIYLSAIIPCEQQTFDCRKLNLGITNESNESLPAGSVAAASPWTLPHLSYSLPAMACWAASHGVCCCRTPKSYFFKSARQGEKICAWCGCESISHSQKLYIWTYIYNIYIYNHISVSYRYIYIYTWFVCINPPTELGSFSHSLKWNNSDRRCFNQGRALLCEPQKTLQSRFLGFWFRPPSNRNPLFHLMIFPFFARYYKAYVESGHTFILALEWCWWVIRTKEPLQLAFPWCFRGRIHRDGSTTQGICFCRLRSKNAKVDFEIYAPENSRIRPLKRDYFNIGIHPKTIDFPGTFLSFHGSITLDAEKKEHHPSVPSLTLEDIDFFFESWSYQKSWCMAARGHVAKSAQEG